MQKRMTKAQASLELLTNYAWTFIVIVVVIGGLYYFDILNFSRHVPERCAFPAQFQCTDYSISDSSVLVKLSNNIGEDLNITFLNITNDAATPISCPEINTTPPIEWPAGTSTIISFTECSNGGLIKGARIDTRVTLTYYAKRSPSRTSHTVVGKISGKVLE